MDGLVLVGWQLFQTIAVFRFWIEKWSVRYSKFGLNVCTMLSLTDLMSHLVFTMLFVHCYLTDLRPSQNNWSFNKENESGLLNAVGGIWFYLGISE